MIRAAVFDLDGTLLDRTTSLRVYLHEQVRRLPQALEATTFKDYLDTFLALDDNGYRERADLFRRIEDAFSMPSGMGDTLLEDFRKHFPHTCAPFPGARQTLSELQRQGVKMGLVTNGRVASQQPKIEGLGIAGYFGVILISEAEGVRKPDREIFRRALEALDVAPEDAVMVGDNPEADIQGATAFGMKAIWKRDEHWEAPAVVDAVIDDLRELPQVIRDLA